MIKMQISYSVLDNLVRNALSLYPFMVVIEKFLAKDIYLKQI